MLDLICLQTNKLRGQKKRDSSDFLKSLFQYPSGARLRYLQLRNRVLNIDIPPKFPFGKGGLRKGSRFPKGIQKKGRPSDLPFQYPLRAWHKPALSGIEGGFFTYGLE